MNNFVDSNNQVHKIFDRDFEMDGRKAAGRTLVDKVPKPGQFDPFNLETSSQANPTEFPATEVYTCLEAKDSQHAPITPDNYQFDSEIHEQKLVRKTVRAGMTVFDIGANIGKYVKLFSILVGDKGRVYAFEPSERSFEKLVSTIRQFNCTNVMLINKAVYSENRNVIINEFPEEYSSWNSLGLPNMKNPRDPTTIVPIEKSAEVEAVTLDSFCQQLHISRIDYLKLDVEGSELNALLGSSGLLEKKAISYLQFEISKPMLDGLNTKAKFIFGFLESKGYECHTINKDGKIGDKVSDSSSFYENYISFPSKSLSAELTSKSENTDREKGHTIRNTTSSFADNCKLAQHTACQEINVMINNTTGSVNHPKYIHSTETPMYGSFTDGDLWTPQTYMQRAIMDWLNQTFFEPHIVLSIDKNPPLDAIIIRRWPGVKIHRATYPEFDAQDLSRIADNQYDLVYSNQILEHIPKPWVAAAEMVRVLRPGGLGLHTTCAFNPRHGLPDFNDYYRFLPDGLAELFEGVKVLVKAGWGNRQALLYNLAVDDGHGALGGRRFCEQLGQRNDEQYPWHVWIIFEKF
ncbi:MAG: FkbM family methyltransferase [Planctomycetota bacterium]